MTLALIASPHDETEPIKATQGKAEAILILTSPKISIPPHFGINSGKSMGFWRLNWLHLKGRINRLDGTNKNVSEVWKWSHLR
jgi:hypothetical protein